MLISIIICLVSFAILVWWLRRIKISIGLPIAYLFSLLFIHVPGAVANMSGVGDFGGIKATEIGIRYTALGVIAFVIGVIGYGMIANIHYHEKPSGRASRGSGRFNVFCVVGGLMLIYMVREFVNIPTVNAIVDKGGAIWILGVLVGLQDSVRRRNNLLTVIWLGVMLVFPVITLFRAGFLSFGSVPVFIILSGLVIFTRSWRRVCIAIPVVAVGFSSLFLGYFQYRDEFRSVLGQGGGVEVRVKKSVDMASSIAIFDPKNMAHFDAFDLRLNQNFFVGRAVEYIEEGTVDYLYGRSIWEGAISLIPRIVWPSKPVYGGSPGIIMEMTGFAVNDETSMGVGNVMEFYINFGIWSLIIGFVILGGLFGWLDRHAAVGIRNGELTKALVYFLPAVAMIHPNGSIVELVGGAGVALIAALLWGVTWQYYISLMDDSGSLSGRRRVRRKRLGQSPDQAQRSVGERNAIPADEERETF